MRAISVTSQKGGVGKTTIAVSVSHGLAGRGHSVLLVDVDPQGHASFSLGCRRPEMSLQDVIIQDREPEEVAVEIRPKLWLIPMEDSAGDLNRWLAAQDGGDLILRRRLRGYARNFDYVIFDCATGRTDLCRNAWLASGEVWIPVLLEALSLNGLSQAIDIVARCCANYESDIALTAIIPNQKDMTRRTKDGLQLLSKKFGYRVTTPLVSDTMVAEAPAARLDGQAGATIWEYRRNYRRPRVIDGYELLLDELLLTPGERTSWKEFLPREGTDHG